MEENIENIRISAVQPIQNLLVITISAGQSKDFCEHLRNHGVTCSTPNNSVFNVVVDKNGREIPIPSICNMIALGTYENFQTWVDEFYPTKTK